MPESPVARHLVVHGRVQGVFFRDRTRGEARRHGVAGWVRNDPDGSVAVWLEGDRAGVDAVEGWIRAGGPPRAAIRSIDSRDVDPAGHEGFVIAF